MDNLSIPESELIINADGSVYHLHLRPEQLAETIITVGDPGRVAEVSKYFDSIEHKVQYREFITHTGYLNNKRLTVLSTGMGTDNIDIVLNELDALANIDFTQRRVKETPVALNIIRVGTSGAIAENVQLNEVLISEIAFGLDGLMHFYEHENSIWETVYLEAFTSHIKPFIGRVQPYIAPASAELLGKFEAHFKKGTTLTACGFYAPQGRRLRALNTVPAFTEAIRSFRHKHFCITNMEMETAGIYGLGRALGHRCLSVNAILAHRLQHTFSARAAAVVDKMIEQVLEIITGEL